MLRRSLLALCFAVALTRPAIGAELAPAALRATDQWLALLDAGDYAGSWRQAGEPFRSAVPQEQWTKASAGARQPLGPLKQRALKSTETMRTLPGVPDGEYAVLQFDAVFERKAAAVETVALALEADGQWRVVGYFVR